MRRNFGILTFMIVLLAIFQNEGAAADIEYEKQAKVNIIFNDRIDHEILSKYGINVIHEYESIQAVTAEIKAHHIPTFSKEDKVKSIQYDQSVSIQSQMKSWGYDSLNIDSNTTSSLTGKGVNIAVIDSGVDRSHLDLNIAGGECFLGLASYPDACAGGYNDDNGHGTHVAGIMAALDNGFGVVGVAPEANLFALKVLDKDGEGTTSSVVAAIDWAIQNEMDIINLSLDSTSEDLILKEIIQKAYQSDILIVAAAGNQENITGLEEGVRYPAKYDEVIAVTALDKGHIISKRSAFGPAVEFSAPGKAILSTYPKNLQDDNGSGYARMSGTSMAAPFVSGMAALYMERHPDLSKVEIRNLLQENAIDLGEPGRDTKYGYGLVQPDWIQKGENESNISITTEEATVRITLKELPLQSAPYNLYRNDSKIISNGMLLSTADYGVRGEIEYRLVPIVDGKENREEEEIFIVNVDKPSIKDMNNQTWFTRNMLYLYREGIMKGYSTGELKPYQLITREEAVMLLVNAIGLPLESNVPFNDVDPKSVAAGHIGAAAKKGIIDGFLDGTFRPKQAVTRAEMSILISKAYELSGIDSKEIYFSDISSDVTGYEHIKKVVQNDIAQGYLDQTFRPHDYMNRATFAVFLSRAEHDLLK